jgi:hypothetical protein
LGYSSSTRRPMTFVQEQKSLRTDYYTSPESFKQFGECCVYRVTSTMESPIKKQSKQHTEQNKKKIGDKITQNKERPARRKRHMYRTMIK